MGMNIGYQNACPSCAAGHPCGYSRKRGRIVHSVYSLIDGKAMKGKTADCANADDECRFGGEPYGFYQIAWLPKRCRNGRWRWLCWVERHSDGTYTLGNRAG